MTKIISLFNHKGGVSKTTTTFHLGWKMAALGKRVLIVDADPQCNLTGLALGKQDYDSLAAFYDSKQNTDIFTSLAPTFALKAAPQTMEVSFAKTNTENLFILAGHIRFSEIDIQLATALTSSETIPVLRQFIGSINKLLRDTADQNGFDLVLIDTSPSVSATNQCILMSSDYFIIPTSPDFYCYQAIDSLSRVLPKWSKEIKKFRVGDYALPKNNPKMLGFISQNYRVYTKKAQISGQKSISKAYQVWLDKIKNVTNEKLVPALNQDDMVVEEKLFQAHVHYDSPYHLAGIQNFNKLIPASQFLAKPIYELTQEDGKKVLDIPWAGAAWQNTKNSIKQADEIYSQMATSILAMLNNDPGNR